MNPHARKLLKGRLREGIQDRFRMMHHLHHLFGTGALTSHQMLESLETGLADAVERMKTEPSMFPPEELRERQVIATEVVAEFRELVLGAG